MNRPPGPPSARRPLRRDRRGIASLEFAFVASALFLMALAIFDIGAAIQQRLVLQQAARAAAQYAILFPTQAQGIIAAATQALPPGSVGVNITSSACFCAQSGQPAACGTICAGSSGSYVIISLQQPFSPFVFNVGNCSTVSGNTTVNENCASNVVRFQ